MKKGPAAKATRPPSPKAAGSFVPGHLTPQEIESLRQDRKRLHQENLRRLPSMWGKA